MTTRRGDTWAEIIALAAPVVISKLSFTAMAIVDTAMVGRLGAVEQGAVGIATTYMFTLYVFGLGLLGVVNTFVSQHHGAGRPEECGVVLGHGLRLSTGIAAVTLTLLLASRPLFEISGLSPAVVDAAYEYLLWRVIGLFPVFWYWAYNGFLEGLGETRTPMRISLLANAANIVLDWTLIFGAGRIPAMGVRGAGLATAASNGLMFLCFLWVVHRRTSPWRAFGVARMWAPVRWDLVRRMIRVGLPMGVQFFLEIGAFLFFSVMVGWVGDVPLAANQVALRVTSVSFMTSWGISVASTTLVGRHQGEREPDLAFASGHRTVALALGFTLVCGLLFAAMPNLLARIFTPNPAVRHLATELILIAAAVQIFDGLNIVSYGALKGAGDTAGPLGIVVVMNWGVGVPLVYLLTIRAGLGALGAWLGILVMLAGQGGWLYLRFRAGRWKSLRVVEAGLSPR